MCDSLTGPITLRDISKIVMGQAPPGHTVVEAQVGVPFLQGCAEFGLKYPQHKRVCSSPAKICDQEDILISVRAPVGELNRADQKYCIGRGLAAIRFHVGFPQNYGWYLLDFSRATLRKSAQGSTFEAVNRSDIENLTVNVLPYSERPVVAAILDSVDEAIRQTEAVIAKLRQVKAGMLHDLLICGLDENGELRDPIRHPEQFKESPLGMIPKDWEIESLGNHIFLLSGQHIEAKCYSENSKHVPYLTGPADFPEGRIIVTKYTAFPKVVCRSGDILITVKGSGTGKTIVTDASYSISRQLMAVRAKTCSPRFLHYLLTSFSESLRADASGLIPGIARMDLLDKKISCPPISEQQNIADKLDSFDQDEEKEKQQLYKLLKFKHGLMHDLLTGTVRVPANLLEAIL